LQPNFRKISAWLKYRKDFHHYTYVIGIASLGACLSLSVYVISVSVFLLVANWLVEGNLKSKFLQVYCRKSLLLLTSIFLLYLLGMAWTENVLEGAKRILSLMPFMAMTVILGTTAPVSRKELKFILLVFITSTFVSCILGVGKYFGWFGPAFNDIREISIFIYIGYLALMANFAILILLYFIFFDYFSKTTGEIVLYVILIAFFVFFIFFLRSVMGIVIFFVVIPAFLIILIPKVQSRLLRKILNFIPIMLVLSAVFLLSISVARYYQVHEEELAELQPLTVNGNEYCHNKDMKQIENGHYVWIYVCQEEMRQEWNSISRFDYDGLDQKGQHIKYTLIRYLTSKGLRKDSSGIHQLNSKDIDLIENGYANYIFSNKFGLYQRIYQIIWEIDNYHNTGEVFSHSVAQRIAFTKQVTKIFRNHLLLGVGTGDVRESMIRQSKQDNLQFQEAWIGQPHNQYLNFLATFGLIGFCWIFFAMIYPLFLEKKQNILLFIMFLVLYMISMLSFDMFDAHVGVSFFAFFYSLFLYYWETDTK
jgi:hypothetical protein